MIGEPRRTSRSGLLSTVYARITGLRRAWYARPGHTRRLPHPVISVGNLSMGGSGKTPVVAAVARLLQERGERPAILTRGYGRREATEGVLVVSDGQRVLQPVERSGDEPQWLARTLPGVPVLVSTDRYVAGLFAACRLGTTVSLLDDGFQHVQLERDVDLLLVSPGDLNDRVAPAGHLREPLDVAQLADAVLVPGSADDVIDIASALGHSRAFRVVASYANLSFVGRALSGPPGEADKPRPTGERVVAFAGIARPERFFNALRSLGYEVARELRFPDHHWYTTRDIRDIQAASREVNASIIVTTEKDAVRCDMECAVLPMTVEIDPAADFEQWLIGRLRPKGCVTTPDAYRSTLRSGDVS